MHSSRMALLPIILIDLQVVLLLQAFTNAVLIQLCSS